MRPALLLLTDSRLPAGGHAHSGGAERAVTSGAVHDVPSLAHFLRGRLRTAGAVAAALTAAACTHASAGGGTVSWEALDAEVDARTASPAQREASRTQGRLLLRVARRIWPSPVLDELARAIPSPHHPLALGAAAHAAGCTPEEAALAAAYHAVTGPATAAVRLLGLDPVSVHAVLATLTPDLTAVATHACRPSDHLTPLEALGALPACSAPALDLLAEQHARAEVRLFIS
ncbi:urease accessory UreF family protein [Nonomuraea fuscirosea]|uniref:urease accessory protein UreF n=1 Tax=Nonomuraea fuscirosea TaxID=1291556 RepID=UPI002DD8B4ED|nr:urease accessory UreF family protein [Nonomuraea fuscirosea]WSA49231.1 urease accessory protein UreF [Nonomuraea fuscirosea]